MGEQVGEAVSYGKMRDFTVLSISNIYLKGLKSTLSFFLGFHESSFDLAPAWARLCWIEFWESQEKTDLSWCFIVFRRQYPSFWMTITQSDGILGVWFIQSLGWSHL